MKVPKRFDKVPKVYNAHPNARRAYRDYRDGALMAGRSYVPQLKSNGEKKNPELADELYVIAVGCNWKPSKLAYGPKKGFEKIGVLTARKPSPASSYPDTVALSVVLYTQVGAHYNARAGQAPGAPPWFVADKISEGGRRKIWSHAREVFGTLWPGESLFTEPEPIVEPTPAMQRVSAAMNAIADMGKAPPIKLLGPKTITVQANGVSVTGSREDIRELLFGEE